MSKPIAKTVVQTNQLTTKNLTLTQEEILSIVQKYIRDNNSELDQNEEFEMNIHVVYPQIISITATFYE